MGISSRSTNTNYTSGNDNISNKTKALVLVSILLWLRNTFFLMCPYIFLFTSSIRYCPIHVWLSTHRNVGSSCKRMAINTSSRYLYPLNIPYNFHSIYLLYILTILNLRMNNTAYYSVGRCFIQMDGYVYASKIQSMDSILATGT